MCTRWLGFVPALFVLVLSACAADPALRLARLGDTQALAHELERRDAQHRLDDEMMVAVARSLLAHDVQRFGGIVGERRLLSLSSCARGLRDTLRDVARGDDEVAAAAAFTLVSQDLVDHDQYLERHREDRRPLFRAAATWGLIERRDAPLRRVRLGDDDLWVRRAAIEATVAARDTDLVGDLLAMAHRDPDLLVKVTAVRAVTKLAEQLRVPSQRQELATRLQDVAVAADEPVRSAIARAWVTPALRSDSSMRLLAAAATERGPSAVDAAAALATVSPEGELLLGRVALDADDPEVRMRAIRWLDPSRPASLDVLRQLAGLTARANKEAPEVVELAAEQLLRAPALRGRAEAVLVTMLSRPDRIASEAALALASVGRADGLERLRGDLRISSHLRPRIVAALVALHHAAEARAWLTAPDLDVRDPVACALVAARQKP